ncbi:uncharacterized protein LOC128956891 [Oppia nitens]|uniref:uncharacterized protein LOC128956891 n=1 Tax=Oppia nitens TaxID=1686743 RepID=UPI0023D9D475|nr:uncharacterized protein LOC128956891 [Oppia nitens]
MKVTIFFGLILLVLHIFDGQGLQQTTVIYERNDQAFTAHQLGNNNYKQIQGFKEFKYGNAYKTQQGFKDYQMKKHANYELVTKATRKPYTGSGKNVTLKLRLDKRYTSNDNNVLVDYRAPLTRNSFLFQFDLEFFLKKYLKNSKIFIRNISLNGERDQRWRHSGHYCF